MVLFFLIIGTVLLRSVDEEAGMAQNMNADGFKDLGSSRINGMFQGMDTSQFKDLGGDKLRDMAKNMEGDGFKDLGGEKVANK